MDRFSSMVERGVKDSSGIEDCVVAMTAEELSASTDFDKTKNSFYLSVHKAGLEGVDKDKVHQVISKASKGSSYYNSEELRLKDVKIKVAMY